MQLTQEERRKKLLDYAQKFPINDIPGISSITDEESKFVRVSTIGVDLSGYKNEDQMFGTGYGDLKADAHKVHEVWENDEKFARQTKNIIRIISYANFDTGWKVLFGHQKPLIDKESNEVIGLINNFIDITKNAIFDVGRLILMESEGLKRKQFQYRVQDHEGFEGLSKREQEVLFWYSHGINSLGISKRLSKPESPLSPNTVRSYLAKIKLKLGVSTKEQLLEKSISLGFMCTVPESLFVN
jgi:DNA-binding CsgD family transcriptional regulator